MLIESIAASLAPYPIALVLLGGLVWLGRENKRLRVAYEGDPGDGEIPPKIGRLEALRREYEGIPGDDKHPGRINLVRAGYEAKLAEKDLKIERMQQEQIDTLKQLARYLEDLANQSSDSHQA